MRRLTLLAALLLAATGCGKSAPPPPPAPATAAPDTTPAEDVVKVEPSPLAELAPTLAAPLDGDAALASLIAATDRLAAWIAAHPDAAGTPSARLAVARARLAAAIAGPPAELHRAVAAVGAEADALVAAKVSGDGLDPARLAAAARAIGALDPANAASATATADAFALAAGDDDAALAVRAAWLAAAEAAVAALDPASPDHGTALTSPGVARLLCPGCAEAGALAPDAVLPWLLDGDRGAGLVCAKATAGAPTATDAAARADLLLTCDGLRPSGDAELALAAGANVLELGLLQRALAFATLPDGAGPLAPVVKARRDAVLAALAPAHPLPVPTLTEPLPAEGDRPDTATLPAPIAELAAGGLAPASPALAIFIVGPDGVRAGVRPTLGVHEGQLVSVSRRAGAALEQRPAVTLEGPPLLTLTALAEAEVARETGAVAALTEGASTLSAMTDAVTPTPTDSPRTAELVLDALAPTAAVERTLDSARAAGYSAFRFARTATSGATLALLVRDAPAAPPTAATPGYAQPIIVHLTRGAIDVWGPDLPADPAPAGDAAAVPPEALEAGFRGTRLVRLRATPVEADARGLTAPTRAQVADAIAYWRQASGHGALIHVVGANDALAADVLRVAQGFQEAPGANLDAPEALWPGMTCPPAPAGAEGPICATGVAVAFSKIAVPSSRGVTSAPKKAEVKVVLPPPSPEFCNERDIKSQMMKQTRDFRYCYESQLRLDDKLEGKVPVTFAINLDGSVSNVTVGAATLKNPKVSACLVKAVQKMRFGKPDGGRCLVRWPFVFQKH